MNKVRHKWGFGMATVKPEVLERRRYSVRMLIRLLESIDARQEEFVSSEWLEHISVVKGLFTRTYKKDQWDWFTTYESLGRPSKTIAYQISSYLKVVRKHLKGGEFEKVAIYLQYFRKIQLIDKYLSVYLSGRSAEYHQIYVLSTREDRDTVKIGFTTRNISQRVKEINAGTGVLYPYSVYDVWTVEDKEVKLVEKLIHEHFEHYRIRADREFFDISYVGLRELCRKITLIVHGDTPYA